ncbi:MAG: ROK family protein [Microbacterium sp.]
MTSPLSARENFPGSPGNLVRLVREGAATTRSALARATGLATSTASIRVDTLLEHGVLVEAGDDASRGGRRARLLAINDRIGVVAVADIGASHANLAVADAAGRILTSRHGRLETGHGPESTVSWLWAQLREMLTEAGAAESDLFGIAIGVPAPVEHSTGTVILPSFMPSWHRADIPSLFRDLTDALVLVENDANLVALGEHAEAPSPRADHLLAIKLGTRIGCGIVSDSRLHRGAGGGAGEISHTTVDGESLVSCTCGVPNCLESVAGGGAIVERLRRLGQDVEDTAAAVALGEAGVPEAVEALQSAGSHIGRVLSAIVNFHNPNEVVLGGSLSRSALLVAAVRAEIFQRCLPLVANDLTVRASNDPMNAGITGAIGLAWEAALGGARVEELLQRSRALSDQSASSSA